MIPDSLLGQIIQCHLDKGDPETFVVGRLVCKDDKWFLMQSISPHGKWDGLALYLQSDIISIETATSYIKKLDCILSCRRELAPMHPDADENLLEEVLCFAEKNIRIVGIELFMSGYRDVCGYIESSDKFQIAVYQYDEFGKKDGKSFIDCNAITRVFVGDEELDCLEMLVKAQQQDAKRVTQAAGDGDVCWRGYTDGSML